jgi:phosphonate transport system permease protein
VALFWLAGNQTGFALPLLWEGAADFFRFFGKMKPDWRALPEQWAPLLETVNIAYLGTLFGTILSLPLIFLASFNTTINTPVQLIARAVMTLIRSIPDLLYAAILAPVLAIGPLPGVVALTIFTMAILAKLGSETVEAIDPGPLEALRASGANGLQVIVYAVLPQIAATMVSYVLYTFEINVRASTVLGLVGGGGIGQLLNTYLGFRDYPAMGVLIIVTFAAVLLIDSLSTYVRTRLL